MAMKELLEKIPFYNQLTLPYHFLQAGIAGVKNGFPARKLTVIAVTGTNGKTSTCFMIWKMLNEAGKKTGLLTTVAWGVDKLEPELNHMTTVDSMTLNGRIRKIAEQGVEYLVLETTSHAMAQFRTLGIPVEIAVMTNVTHEHLDYHKTFENYRKAKCKLFKKAKFGVINMDDKSAKWFEEAARDYVTYGIKKGEKRAKDVQLAVSGVSYEVDGMKIQTKIPGEFNVYNSLAAVCVGEKLGLSREEIEKGIFALESVEGRMNRIDEGQDFTVIVDYAHAPDALEKVFASIGKVKGKIISLHGGAGRRDPSTRAPRGEILGKNSDIVIITEDDSRDEDPAKIAEQFVVGAEKVGKRLGKDLFVELDRGKAIEMAIGMAKKDDMVLILGKGHEKTILRKDGPVEFEDVKVAKKILRKRAS
ncbi:UDP-N-acetylmuramoyl-L-alanyl-D-glutamate--2,6-diaminopimelate ligase [Candidatus Saccharibacteria bacterium]|nr:UDP-N-acetylmuramoyl-L-alanyl-D-glutamate--2,6-diaminopimelate ligase [Candidatus Saccharibacteria bacterium]